MYAVVDIGGKQWKVEKADTIRVPSLDAKPDKSLSFDRVLLVVDKGTVHIGNPIVSNARVLCTVLNHGKADKIKVFKKKRRKDYQVLKGHRQLSDSQGLAALLTMVGDNTRRSFQYDSFPMLHRLTCRQAYHVLAICHPFPSIVSCIP